MVGVYPRACGGTICTPSLHRPSKGLSPRVRGNPTNRGSLSSTAGSIPARAGEPAGHHAASVAAGVYPRACGGTVIDLAVQRLDGGLSPRVRGNQFVEAAHGHGVQSIPARAGEPLRPDKIAWPHSVYPRACGGTATNRPRGFPRLGLSPRVRGNLHTVDENTEVGRSIPARAGEPRAGCPGGPLWWVYPRACGGTIPRPEVADYPDGLSPRVRGNPPGQGTRGRRRGSIPARAGEPARARDPRTAPWVYPRACGGTSPAVAVPPSRMGLSPRVRGNRTHSTAVAHPVRSIPARAGEPT